MKNLQIKKVNIRELIGGGYDDFWRDKSRYRVVKGGKGSKKSTTAAVNLIFRIMKYPLSNLLVIRAVMQTHRDSTFAQLKVAQEMLGVSHLWKNTVSPMEMVYKPTGQKILFRGFDDPLKLASTTVAHGYLCWCWIEEAYEIFSEEDFEKLDFSLPRSDVPPPLFNQTTITFNPWSEKHWLKRRFFDSPDELTSIYTTNYLCNEHLADTYLRAMELLKERNPRRFRVAGLGEWGISEGLVYENWEELEFDVNELGIERDANGVITGNQSWQYRHFFGLDYGYINDPTAFICFVANPITKELFIYDEHYQTKMLNSDIANMITRKGLSKERIRADAAEPKTNDDLRRMHISRIMPSVKGRDSINNGIAALQEYKMFVHPKCQNTLLELSLYCYKKDKSGNTLNEPEDRNNHLMDALRYAFYDVRFFHPQDPSKKERPGAGQYQNQRYGINSSDFKGGWN